MNPGWTRVKAGTDLPRCAICGHEDWCRVGLQFWHCMRSPSPRPQREGGWLHPLDGRAVPVTRHEPPPRPTVDASGMMHRWFSQTTRAQYDALAGRLGVAVSALIALKCAWAQEHRAWAFPMRGGAGDVIGIRLRSDSGRKWSVTGGREGIFLPRVESNVVAYVAEGPTDAAALVTLGKFGIGRPSCSGGIAALSATVARLRVRRVIVIADNDEDRLRPGGERWNPGLDGAQRLSEEIGVPCCIVVLPTKDCREFVQVGGTSELLDSLTQSVVWNQPKQNRQITHASNLPVPVLT